MMYRVLFVFSVFAHSLVQGQDVELLRFPDLDPEGERITFSYQGDIWMADVEGRYPVRLTVNEAYDAYPRWSQDGQKIAFVSNRYGNSDIFEINFDNLQITRKTYYDSRDVMPSWTPEGEVAFLSRRAFAQVEREMEVHVFEKGKATPNRALSALAMAAEPSYDKDLWGVVKGYCRLSREAYRGPAQRDVFAVNRGTGEYTQITFDEGQDVQVRWSEDHVFVLSARGGVYNVYRKAIADLDDQKEWEKLTSYKQPGVRYFDVSRDGNTLVVERGDQVILIEEGKERRINFEFPGDAQISSVTTKTFSSQLADYAVSPGSEQIALEVRGDILLTQNDEEKSRTVNISRKGSKDESPQWLNDTTLLFISDRQGKESIYRAQSADEDLSDLFWTYQYDVKEFVSREDMILGYSISPKKDGLLLFSEPGVMEYAPIDTLGNLKAFEVLHRGWNMPDPGSVTWSPDGRWIAYSQRDLNFNVDVFIMNIVTGETANVSMHPRRDHSPVWSPDGSKLAFVSNRNNGDDDIWFAWANREDYLRATKDWDEMEDYPVAMQKRLNMEEDTTDNEDVDVDVENIHRRLVQLTAYAGDEDDIAFDKDGEMVYFTRSNADDSDLMKIKWNKEDEKRLMSAKGINKLSLGPKEETFYFIQKGKLKALQSKEDKAKDRPFSARLEVDAREDMAQVFDEAWRLLDANFYDPDFHGQDFDKLKAKYRPICMKASTKQDFRDMFNEMLGQLNASHMGLYGDNPERTQKQSSGKLGAEFKATNTGLEVVRVVPHGPLDKKESKVEVGEIITHINGKALSNGSNAYESLIFKSGERVWLTIADNSGQKREVYPRCTSSESSLLYDEWVESRRELTEKYSDGKLGYIHVQGMNWPSFEVFERELMASGYGKEGIVIDVRYNGGGWTTDMLMTVLNVQQHAYTIPRGASESLKSNKEFREYYPYGERLPLSWWTKPAAALCNEFSYSNAEIFSHAFKNLDRGPLVGEPTFGAVISTGGKGLMDGSWIRLPFRGWFVKKSDKNMDFTPAVPDHIVESELEKNLSGDDAQLKKAVELLLKGE